MLGKRIQVDKKFVMMSHEFIGQGGRLEKSELEFCLNTYQYTSMNQSVSKPSSLRLNDIKELFY